MSDADDIQASLEQRRRQVEKEQAERSAQKKPEDVDPERKKEISDIRAASDSAAMFSARLEKAGYVLAAGQTGYCVVSKDGVFNLLRHAGMKKVRFEALMSAIPLKSLPMVKEVLEGERAKKTEPKSETYDDPKLASLMQALAERQKEELRRISDRHAFQLRQEEWKQDSIIADKIAAYRAAEEKRREAFIQSRKEDRTGIKAVIDIVRNWSDPTLSAQKEQAREKELQQFNRYLAKERKGYETPLYEDKVQRMAVLDEKQRQELAAFGHQGEAEKERYKREHHEARRIAAELEAQQRREELEKKSRLSESFPSPQRG